MKLKVLLVSALMVSMFSCKKEEEETTTSGTTGETTTEVVEENNCHLDQITSIEEKEDDGQTEVDTSIQKIARDGNHHITKIERLRGNGTTIDEVIDFTLGTDGVSNTAHKDKDGKETGDARSYTYANGKLKTITESRMRDGQIETKTHTYTWTDGAISAYSDGETSFKDMVYTDGNLTSVSVVFPDGDAELTVTYDDKFNIDAKYYLDGMPLSYFNKNNIVKVVAANQFTIPDGPIIPKGEVVVETDYTYDSKGNVTKKELVKDLFSGKTKSVTTYEHTCE